MPQLRVAIWRAVSSKRQAVKISLTEQERLAREWTEKQGGEVVSVLTVPGHSRREADVLDLFEDYAQNNITAYSDLRQMWKSHEFDVLHAYDDSRFGRSATLATYVMENTLLSGASIYYHEGGWLKQEGGFRYRIAVGSATSAGDVDKMVERSKMGKLERAKKGLNNGSVPPISHRVIRDPINGKGLRLEVDESRRRMFDDIAELLIAGVSWEKLGTELAARGHLSPRGVPFSSALLYKLILNPQFWGNQALIHAHRDDRNHNQRGLWAFDKSIPHPPEIDIFYDTLPSVYKGDQAEQVKRELRRRAAIMRGKASPGHTRMFTGLVVCGSCWRTMETQYSTSYYGLRCGQRYKHRGQEDCPNIKPIPGRVIRQYIENRIARLLEGEPVTDFSDLNTTTGTSNQLNQLRADVTLLSARIRNMQDEQSLATTETLRADYRGRVKTLDAQRALLNTRVIELEWEYEEQQHYLVDAQKALEFIVSVGPGEFWNQEMRVINQTLFDLLCNRQIVVFEGECKGTRPRQAWSRRPSV